MPGYTTQIPPSASRHSFSQRPGVLTTESLFGDCSPMKVAAQDCPHPEVVIGSPHWIQECKHLGSFLDQSGAIPALQLPMGLARMPGVEQCGSTFLHWFPHDFFTSLKIFPTAPPSNHRHTNLWLRIHFPENPIKDTSSVKPPNRLNRNSTTWLYTVYLYPIENVWAYLKGWQGCTVRMCLHKKLRILGERNITEHSKSTVSLRMRCHHC